MMEAARTSKTLVNFYQTTRRYNPEDSHLSENCFSLLELIGFIFLYSVTGELVSVMLKIAFEMGQRDYESR
jgi:hypothetical protein